jgi:hypothetical protein
MFPGDHPDLHVPPGEDVIKSLISRPPEETLNGIIDIVPFLLEQLLARLLGRVDVQLIKV